MTRKGVTSGSRAVGATVIIDKPIFTKYAVARSNAYYGIWTASDRKIERLPWEVPSAPSQEAR